MKYAGLRVFVGDIEGVVLTVRSDMMIIVTDNGQLTATKRIDGTWRLKGSNTEVDLTDQRMVAVALHIGEEPS